MTDILAPVMEGLDELERYLETAQPLTWGEAVLEGAHPDKHRIVLDGGVQVMAKPGHDQYERTVRREAAGWQVARRLGFTGLVAGTVLREAPRISTGEPVMSSVQVTWPDGRQWLTPLDEFSEEETWAAAVFDAVVAHTDHLNNNWLGVPDPSAGGQRRLRLVDTGNAFGTTGMAPPSSSFYNRHNAAELPEWVLDALSHFLEDCPGPVENLVGVEEADGVCQRAARLSESRGLSLP